MSGIFGLLGPAGADPAQVASAADTVTFRGVPLVQASGPVVLGAYAREGQEPALLEGDRVMVAAHARVDGFLPGTDAARVAPGGSAVEILDAVLGAVGPMGLAGMAADFAVARWDERSGLLTLSRDAFGLRPLYWARHGGRVAFASDPEVLVALGMTSGDLDREPVLRYLAMRDFGGERTAFSGIRRVVGGRWISFEVGGRASGGRWFRPEEVAETRSPLEQVAEEVADRVTEAAASRAAGERVTLLLSGGRDSGAVAVALARAGVAASCVTQTFDPTLGFSEEGPARQIAGALGHPWTAHPAPDAATAEHFQILPLVSGTPLGLPAFPQAIALRDAVAEVGTSSVLDGVGGEPLFSAAPVAVLDILRSGHLWGAAQAARGFHHRWIYPYPILAKAAARALMPDPLLRLREGRRPVPPWVAAMTASDLDPLTAPRDAREHLVMSLQRWGAAPDGELMERLLATVGMTYASPLLDQRVVHLALTLPVDLRIPVPGPKPVLSRALLDGFESTRTKARMTAYFARLAEHLVEDFPALYEEGGPTGAVPDLVRAEGLAMVRQPEWRMGALHVASVAAWLAANGPLGRRSENIA